MSSDDGDDEGCMLGRGTRAGRDGFIPALLFLVDRDMFVCRFEVDFCLVIAFIGDATRDFNLVLQLDFSNMAVQRRFGQSVNSFTHTGRFIDCSKLVSFWEQRQHQGSSPSRYDLDCFTRSKRQSNGHMYIA